MSGIINPYTPAITSNMTSTRAPLVTDDSSQGYSPGSSWQNTTLGVRWTCRDATVGAAVWIRADNSDFFGFVSGRYYCQFGVASTQAGSALPVGTMRGYPMIVKERATFTAMGLRVTTLSAGGNAGVALYNIDPATRFPGPLIVSVNGLTTAGATAVGAAIAGTPVEAGLYWLMTQCDNATAIFTSLSNTGPFAMTMIGSATEANAALSSPNVNYSYTGQTYGTWPSDFTGNPPIETLTSGVATPYVHLKD